MTRRKARQNAPSRLVDRVAAFHDLENLLYDHEEMGALEQGLKEFAERLTRAVARNTVAVNQAVCAKGLARKVAVPLARLGIRTFTHDGGPDAADLALIKRIAEDMPSSCGVLIIGSGDGRFATIALQVRALGIRVEVIAVRGKLSRALEAAADKVHLLPAPTVKRIA